ncbi:hypothetical protein RIF29_14494 [Crotalaria pallida]|uniref:Uncharacterized protein n=1 Tax=Crotalaria pallida TaxID=3830 RepID=A0AAN9ICT2_CROPI
MVERKNVKRVWEVKKKLSREEVEKVDAALRSEQKTNIEENLDLVDKDANNLEVHTEETVVGESLSKEGEDGPIGEVSSVKGKDRNPEATNTGNDFDD